MPGLSAGTIPLNAKQRKVNAMQFERRQFAGMPLDILVGHPEHELLFIASQVATAAGLKDPGASVKQYATLIKREGGHSGVLRVGLVLGDNLYPMRPQGVHAPTWGKMYLFSEVVVYQMLLRGHAPESEPFRRWVTEEVLPSIRKTGTYTMPAAQEQQPALPAPAETAELYARIDRLESKVDELLELVRGLDRRPPALALPQPPSPYEKTTAVILPDEVDRRQLLEIGEMCITRPAMEKLTGHVLLTLEHQLDRMWKAEDGVALEVYVSKEKGRKWTKWPKSWLAQKLKRQLYQQTIRQVISEYLTR